MFCGGCGNNIGNYGTCPNCGWTASGKKIKDKKEDSSEGSIIGGIILLVVGILILRSCIGC